ncbi:MAG TPA: hypothetical protein PLV73_12015 [Treponemataceae bacterium]|nr:hypothetical protein [Treponemataceae bacterium]
MSENKHLTPVWIVYVDGKRLDVEHEGALKRISVNDRLNGVSSFSLLFDTSAVKIRDKGLIAPESVLSIHLGYKDDVDEVFEGEVLGFRAILAEYGTEQLEVTGCNCLHKLGHGTHYRSFEEMTPSDAVAGVLDAYSLDGSVEAFGATRPFFSQQGQTDLDFVLTLAGKYGKDVYGYGKKVFIANEITEWTDEIIFEWGKSLIHFEAEENFRPLVSDCRTVGWDALKNESFVGEAAITDALVKVGGSSDWTKLSKGGSGLWTDVIVDHAVVDAEEAKMISAGKLTRNSWLFSRARGSAEGNYKLKAGMRVTIKMAGEAFSGEYIADSVNHVFDYRNGYRTEFSLKRNMSPC